MTWDLFTFWNWGSNMNNYFKCQFWIAYFNGWNGFFKLKCLHFPYWTTKCGTIVCIEMHYFRLDFLKCRLQFNDYRIWVKIDSLHLAWNEATSNWLISSPNSRFPKMSDIFYMAFDWNYSSVSLLKNVQNTTAVYFYIRTTSKTGRIWK